QHPGAIDGTDMFLDDIVAGARRRVVAVRPHGGTRVIWKERALERVTVIGTEWIGGGAYRVTHRIRTVRRRRERRRSLTPRGRWRQRRWLTKRGRRARLCGLAGPRRFAWWGGGHHRGLTPV